MDTRPRNSQGQFATEVAGGVDPLTTAVAYDPQRLEQRKLTLIDKLRRLRGVEQTLPQERTMLSAKLRLRELAAYNPYVPAPQTAFYREKAPEPQGGLAKLGAVGLGVGLGLGAGVAGVRMLRPMLSKALYRASRQVTRGAREVSDVAKQAIPEAAAAVKQTAADAQDAMAIGRDLGKAYKWAKSTAAGGVYNVVHPLQTWREMKGAFRAGLKQGRLRKAARAAGATPEDIQKITVPYPRVKRPSWALSAKLRRLVEFSEAAKTGETDGSRRQQVGRAALIGAGILGGGILGSRTLPRLLPRGRLVQEGESLLGKVVYNSQGVTTPAEVLSIPGLGNLRTALRRRSRGGGLRGRLADATLKVDQWLGVPQRHYGVGVGSGRIAEVSKARGRKVVDQESFGKTYIDDEGSILRERGIPRRAEGRAGTLDEKQVEAFNARYEKMQNDPRWKRANVCAAGDSNCEAYARGLARGTPYSRQILAMKAGLGLGGLAGGGAAWQLTREKKK